MKAPTEHWTPSQVNRLCHPKNIRFMKRSLKHLPNVTQEEKDAFAQAAWFAKMWNNENHNTIFIHEFVAKHCDTLLALRQKHFPLHSFTVTTHDL